MNGHADPNARTPATKPGPAAAGPDAAAIGAPASLLAAIDESADALAARIATAAMSGASFHAPQDVFETQTGTNRIWRGPRSTGARAARRTKSSASATG